MKAKKAIKITLIGIAAVVGTIVVATAMAALIMVCLTVFYTDGSELPAERDGLSLDNWMLAVQDDTLLTNVAIPGAHDAECIDMMWAYQTQNTSIEEQLAMGVRYFDIRIANDAGVSRIFHADHMGIEAESVLAAMHEWLLAHPSECLIIDFQHFFGDKEVGSEQAAYVLAGEYLFDMAVRNNSAQDDLTFVKGLTMADVRGKCLVLWGAEDEITDNNWIFLRDNDDGTRSNGVLRSYYVTEYNSSPSKQYIRDYLPLYWQQYDESDGGLFVLQGQLTDKLYVFGPALQETKHDDNMNRYINELPDELAQKANIVMRDYVTPAKSILTVSLNLRKGIVKPQYIDIMKSWQ